MNVIHKYFPKKVPALVQSIADTTHQEKSLPSEYQYILFHFQDEQDLLKNSIPSQGRPHDKDDGKIGISVGAWYGDNPIDFRIFRDIQDAAGRTGNQGK